MNQRKLEDFLLCPKCRGALKNSEEGLECKECYHFWEFESNTLIFENEGTFYWGEIGKSTMKRILNLAQNKRWRDAVDEILLKEYPYLGSMVLSEDRVDWMFQGKRSHLTMLDVGSGWGQTSFLLAKNRTSTVFSLERIKYRALFQGIRKKQDKVTNIHIINGNFLDLNFKEKFLDFILFIGVLEWMGFEERGESPREIQLEALSKAYDLLKPGGIIAIGIENRIGFNNLLGARDHSGLRFTSLMPRLLADKYMKLRKPAFRSNKIFPNYRTYTYTLSGYKNLMKAAGFKKIRTLIAHPHYAHPRCLLEINNAQIREFFKNIYQSNSFKDYGCSLIFRILGSIGAAHIFAPHFLFLASK